MIAQKLRTALAKTLHQALNKYTPILWVNTLSDRFYINNINIEIHQDHTLIVILGIPQHTSKTITISNSDPNYINILNSSIEENLDPPLYTGKQTSDTSRLYFAKKATSCE